MKLRTIYKMDDGNVFEGTEEQLQDCLGLSAEDVAAWCEIDGMKLETYERNVGAYPVYAELAPHV